MERTIRECDRCHNEIKRPPGYTPVTIHDHHARKIDLCGSCRKDFETWLGRFSPNAGSSA